MRVFVDAFDGWPAGAVDPRFAVDAWAGAAATKLRLMTAISRAAIDFKGPFRTGAGHRPLWRNARRQVLSRWQALRAAHRPVII
jgi:hypothetical protein